MTDDGGNVLEKVLDKAGINGPDDDDWKPLERIALFVAPIALGWAAERLVSTIWKRTSKSGATPASDDLTSSIVSAAVFAGVTGIASTIAQRFGAETTRNFVALRHSRR